MNNWPYRRLRRPDEDDDAEYDYEDGDGEDSPWLKDFYEDNYPSPAHQEDYDYSDYAGIQPYSFSEIVEHCVTPTLEDGLAHIGKLLVWCFIFRITSQTGKLPPWCNHALSWLTGLVALSHFFYTNVVYLLLLSAVSYLSLWLAHRFIGGHRGAMVTAACLAFNFASEILAATPQDWHQIRGAQMILTMKAISLAIDVDDATEKADKAKKEDEEKKEAEEETKSESTRREKTSRKRRRLGGGGEPAPAESTEKASSLDLTGLPNINEYLGYALCPGNSVFGPWIKYSDYYQSIERPKWNGTWLVKILLSMIYGFMFLTISTCWNPWMIPDGIWIWWTAYRDAMSFRASHYFVSYVSEASAVTAGLSNDPDGDWGVAVAQPHDIEIPRSLKEVARSWNKPMHSWLKDYVFKKTIACGSFVAVLTTFLASVMLHGMNFQLGAVLFSLGLFSYVEHELRRKLAGIFNASVGTSKSERYRHREASVPVILVNFVFGLLVCFNLAYLGVMFNMDNSMEEGYNWRHTLTKWEELGYLSHFIMGFLLIIGKLI